MPANPPPSSSATTADNSKAKSSTSGGSSRKKILQTSVPKVPELPISQAFFAVQVHYQTLEELSASSTGGGNYQNEVQRRVEKELVESAKKLFHSIARYRMAPYLQHVHQELEALMGADKLGLLFRQAISGYKDEDPTQNVATTNTNNIKKKKKKNVWHDGLVLDGNQVQSIDELYTKLAEANTRQIEKQQQEMDEEQENDEDEYRRLKIYLAVTHAQIGDYKRAIGLYKEVVEDPRTMIDQQMYATFGLLLIGLFYTSQKPLANRSLVPIENPALRKEGLIMKTWIEKAQTLIDKKGDWDRRNRLRAYQCIWKVWQRDYEGASKLFLETIATYESEELMPLSEFIEYGSLACALALDRPLLKKKVIDSPEFTKEAKNRPYLDALLGNFYYCLYDKYFVALADVETKVLNVRQFWYPHMNFYVREMRIRAYTQLLESYRFIKLESVAQKFGVSEQFIENDLAKFITAGRLHFTIDKVKGTVVNNRPDVKNQQYQGVVKKGDELLNRIQALSRIINI
ncbi:proteasome regulatory particle subunit [Mycoemilia scoparia]|uniref:Proteasome regulatory particle subunit n=1 Tax=Mycoemilia scoparia TaxID=417184 RepID=A0A9W7ZP90_9FUNG|nr:proteasome regulatory particle subunit [Mycoemilia scoparia]